MIDWINEVAIDQYTGETEKKWESYDTCCVIFQLTRDLDLCNLPSPTLLWTKLSDFDKPAKPIAAGENPPAGELPLYASLERGAQISREKLQAAAGEQKGADGSTGTKQTICDVASSLTAGVGGAVVGSLLAASPRARALSIPLAMLAGGVTKFSVKSGMEHVLLDSKDRTASTGDLAWGAVDGLSGVAAGFVERRASLMFTEALGRQALGQSISRSTARLGGTQLVNERLLAGAAHNVVRGVSGGAAGSLAWSLPHRVHENWDKIASDPAAGLVDTFKTSATDTLIGGAFGGTLATAGTAIARRHDIAGHTRAWLQGDRDVFKLTKFHINDFHSNFPQLPPLKTKLDELTSQARARGAHTEFVTAGDLEASNPLFIQSKGGVTENVALVKTGMTKAIPGNHPYDGIGGAADVDRYATAMTQVMRDHPELKLLAANLDVSAYPEYARLIKPYVIDEIATATGKQKVATVGLVTQEGAVGNIKYEDALEAASRTIQELNKQGVNKVVILSHLGLEEDVKLAQGLINRNLKAAAIIGGHSHDVTATPLWIKGTSAQAGRKFSWLPFRQRADSFEIPVVQAGSHGRWLGELNLAFKANGAADKYRSFGRMHAITPDMPGDEALRRYVTAETQEVLAHNQNVLNTRVAANYTQRGLRHEETPLGNLVSDSIMSGVRNNSGSAPDMVLMQSGWINDQIVANVGRNGKVTPLTRLDIAKLFKNSGVPSEEAAELGMFRLTGRQIKNALEFGVKDLPAPKRSTLWQRTKSLFADEPVLGNVDEPGDFLQVNGLRYSMDLSKPGFTTPGSQGRRISNVALVGENGAITPLNDATTYNVVTRFHALEKWHKFGLLGEGALPEVHQQIGATGVNISPVDLISQYINGKTIDPAIVGKVTGRIQDLTPVYREPPFKPVPSISAAPFVQEVTREK